MIRSLIHTIDDLHQLVDSLRNEKEFVAACCPKCSQCTQTLCPIKRSRLRCGDIIEEFETSSNKTIIIEFKPKSKK